MVTKVRLGEADQQLKWVKEGINDVVNLKIFQVLTWAELEVRACGRKDIETEQLKAITDYSESHCGPDDEIMQWFWEMFDSFNQDERKKYLKFIWGRTKLPSDTSELSYKHKVVYLSDRADNSLPEAHTCFFTIDIPRYDDMQTMRKRFLTAIELCGEIDNDYDPEDIQNEDDAEGRGGESSYGSEEE